MNNEHDPLAAENFLPFYKPEPDPNEARDIRTRRLLAQFEAADDQAVAKPSDLYLKGYRDALLDALNKAHDLRVMRVTQSFFKLNDRDSGPTKV